MFTEQQISTPEGTLNIAVGPPVGPPLVLLHGVARRWQDYVALAPALAARWQIFALDFRGHGRTSRTTSYRVVDYVRDALAVIEQKTTAPVAVYGHSLGAMVAVAVAAEIPNRVQVVVLEDPPFSTLGSSIRQTAYHGMFMAFRQLAAARQTVDELAATLAGVTMQTPGKTLRLRLGELRDPAALRFMASCLARLDPETMTPLIEGRWLDGYEQESLLRRVTCPALLLAGEYAQGGMLPENEAERVTALLPRGTLVKVAGAGHLIHTMQAETTLRLVTSFLESIDR